MSGFGAGNIFMYDMFDTATSTFNYREYKLYLGCEICCDIVIILTWLYHYLFNLLWETSQHFSWSDTVKRHVITYSLNWDYSFSVWG